MRAMRARVKGALAVVGKVVIALVAVMVLMASHCGGYQMPIDTKPDTAFWVTIYDGKSPRVVGYVLVTGLVLRESLTTTKGNFALEPVYEHWFAADNAQLAADPKDLEAVKWQVQVAEGRDWQAQLASYIDASEGLVESDQDTAWDVRAPAGQVRWAKPSPSPLEGLHTFEHSENGASWQLAIARDGNGFTGVVWGTSKDPGEYTLPGVFAEAGSMVLERAKQAAPSAVFTGQEIAPQ